jgi:hypothetical protein
MTSFLSTNGTLGLSSPAEHIFINVRFSHQEVSASPEKVKPCSRTLLHQWLLLYLQQYLHVVKICFGYLPFPEHAE